MTEVMQGTGRSLKILVVTECFWPDIYAVNDIVEKLVQRGHKVTVLTGLPDYTTTRIPKEYKYGKNRHQNYKGAEVFRVPTIARRHGPIFRSLSYLSFAFNGWLRAKTQDFGDFDVIYVWEVSPVTMAVPAIALKKRYKKPLFLYCMDIWPECVKAMSINEGTLPYKMIHAWTRRIYGQCDHIAVSSKPFFEYLERVNGVKRSVMSYLPQFASGDMLEADFEKSAEAREKLLGGAGAGAEPVEPGYGGGSAGATESVDFLYIGNIGKAQDMGCLIGAISKVKEYLDGRDRTVRFHIVGGGSEFDNVKKMAAESGADKIITFYGPKPFKEAMEYYRVADACILTLDGSTHIGDTLPGKVQTYMAAGKPILGAMNGAGFEVIEESGAGKCVKAGDAKGLSEIFIDFIENTGDYAGCGDKAREYFRKNFTEEIHFRTLEERLESMAFYLLLQEK